MNPREAAGGDRKSLEGLTSRQDPEDVDEFKQT